MHNHGDLDYSEPASLDDISNNLSSIENELLLLNEKMRGNKVIEWLLFFILMTLIFK